MPVLVIGAVSVALAAFSAWAIVAILKRWRAVTAETHVLVVVSAAVLAAVPTALVALGEMLEDGRDSLDAIAKNGDVLVDAIRRCEAETGWAPRELDDLVPKYLAALPPTACPSCRTWSYSSTKPHSRSPGDWNLALYVGDQDEIVYEPDPSTLEFRKVTHSVGDWRYCVVSD